VIEGINSRDYPVILAVVMITAVLVLFFNFIADVTAAILDPRIRL
jgi:peptide/nickel transport system permease protein